MSAFKKGGLYLRTKNTPPVPESSHINVYADSDGEIHFIRDDSSEEIIATNSLVASVSAGLDSRIDSLESATHVNSLEGLTGAVDLSGSNGITITTSGNTINIIAPDQGSSIDHNDLNAIQGGTTNEYYHLTEAQFNDYIGATEVASVSAGLDSRISSNDSDISGIQTDVATISGDLDSLEATVAAIDVVSGTGTTVVESPADTWTVNVDDYISATEVASVSAGLDSRVTTNESDISDLQTATSGITGGTTQLDDLYVNVTGDTMSGTLNLSSGDVNIQTGNLTVAGTGDIGDLQISGQTISNTSFIGVTVDSTLQVNENITMGQGTGNKSFFVSGGTSTTREIVFTGGSPRRWDIRVNNDTESGSNAGSNFDLRAYNDAGVLLSTPLSITRSTGDATFSSDLTVSGDLYVNGNEFIVNTESVSAEDNIIVINAGEVGNGVTAGHAGIRVDRGTQDDYFFLFDEVREAFAVGTATDETSSNISSLQLVATREDSPTVDGFARWNDTLNRFDTVSVTTISNEISGTYVNTTGDTMTGELILSTSNFSDILTLSRTSAADWSHQITASGDLVLQPSTSGASVDWRTSTGGTRLSLTNDLLSVETISGLSIEDIELSRNDASSLNLKSNNASTASLRFHDSSDTFLARVRAQLDEIRLDENSGSSMMTVTPDGVTSNNKNFIGDGSTGSVRLRSSSGSAPYIEIFGISHASRPGEIEYRADLHEFDTAGGANKMSLNSSSLDLASGVQLNIPSGTMSSESAANCAWQLKRGSTSNEARLQFFTGSSTLDIEVGQPPGASVSFDIGDNISAGGSWASFSSTGLDLNGALTLDKFTNATYEFKNAADSDTFLDYSVTTATTWTFSRDVVIDADVDIGGVVNIGDHRLDSSGSANFDLRSGSSVATNIRFLNDSSTVLGRLAVQADTWIFQDSSSTTIAEFDDDSTAGNTRFLIYDVDNGTLERVSVGAADSGGTGFKVLRIPN